MQCNKQPKCFPSHKIFLGLRSIGDDAGVLVHMVTLAVLEIFVSSIVVLLPFKSAVFKPLVFGIVLCKNVKGHDS